jgi:hypothetical protein
LFRGHPSSDTACSKIRIQTGLSRSKVREKKIAYMSDIYKELPKITEKMLQSKMSSSKKFGMYSKGNLRQVFIFLRPRARICKPFKELRNRFPAWRAGTKTLFVVPARQAT